MCSVLKSAWYALGGVLRWIMLLGLWILPLLYGVNPNVSEPSSPGRYLLLWCVLIVGQAVAVVVHELGHLVAAVAVRAKIHAFRLGRDDSLIQFHVRGVLVVLGWPRHGRVEYLSVPSVWKRSVITLAGPLADLLLAAVVLAAPLPVSRPMADVFGLAVALRGLANLMPFKTRAGRLSDGASLLEVAGRVRRQRAALDVAALKAGGESLDRQADRIARIAAAQQKEDLVAGSAIGAVASKLRKEQRWAELIELHAGLKIPSPPIPVQQAAAIVSAEFSVALAAMPGLPSEAIDLAERRLNVLLRYHDLGQSEVLAHLALAFLLLRRGRYADVERHCRPALSAKTFTDSSLGLALAVVILARQGLGQPYEDMLEKAGERRIDAATAVTEIRQILDPASPA